MRIIVVGGDIATAAEGAPIVKAMRKKRHDVQLVMDTAGEGCKKLASSNFSFTDHDVKLLTANVDFVLVLTSATANKAQIDWTRYCKENNVLVAWFEDFPGTANVEAVQKLRPDHMFVIHEAAEKLSKQVRPNVPAHVVGKPSFESRIDTINKARTEQEFKRATREKLGIKDDDFLVTYWSGGESKERAEAHVHALKDWRMPNSKAIFAPRIHPNLNRLEDGLQEKLIQQACSGVARTIDLSDKNVDDINVASDVFVCDAGGTEGMVGPLMGTPTIITRFPDDYARLTTRGLPGGVPSLIACGAAISAESERQLVNHLVTLEMMWWSDGDIAESYSTRCFAYAYPLHSLLQKGAANRIVDHIEKLV